VNFIEYGPVPTPNVFEDHIGTESLYTTRFPSDYMNNFNDLSTEAKYLSCFREAPSFIYDYVNVVDVVGLDVEIGDVYVFVVLAYVSVAEVSDVYAVGAVGKVCTTEVFDGLNSYAILLSDLYTLTTMSESTYNRSISSPLVSV
jgi:hypothetical protein